MKKITLIALSLCLVLAVQSCNNNDDLVQTPKRDGSIETILSCEHKEGFDVLTTTHKIWVKNQMVNVTTRHDTLPSLGQTSVTGEDGDGNTRQAQIPKEYEFYITVQ